jgi:L-threonylcarbamoyladenylate synthase
MVIRTLDESKVAQLLLDGAVGVLPTDTVYGVVCRAADQAAVKRLYALKGREQKPGTIIAASTEQLVELGIKYRYLKAVEQFWPNPLSVEIPHSLEYLHQGTFRQAFRIPKDHDLATLLKKTGPLLTSSANHPGKPTANTVSEAEDYFSESVDFYVDGGDLSGRLPSTILKIVDDAIEVVREGAVTIDENGRMTSL